jgi:membrane dipeptidase
MYLLPGVGHCGVWPETEKLRGTESIDMLGALRGWVEQGRSPSTWVAAHRDKSGNTVLTRPLCRLGTLCVADIEAAKRDGKLAVCFDIEGGRAVEAHPGLVEIFYRLGVRWMLIAYTKNNRLGGGCQDEDTGLTAYGRRIIDEMQRVGMVLCCSHTGYRTAREAIEYSSNPVIFSHSNPRAVWDHPRNIPDDLMRACAATGGVVNLNGIGIFLGNNDNSTERLLEHIDYAVELIGAEHVGLGLDYVFDSAELDEYMRSRTDLFPPDKGYGSRLAMIEPERFPHIVEALLKRGYSETQVQGLLGHNNLRLAARVWR